ncbi:Fatty acid desaturase 2-like protein [Hordeum vulgare]|nr:Fatty acid desaturase 2-like protein [Hordeum vulgare]
MARTGLADATAPDADAMSAATKDVVDVRMISTKELQAHAATDDLWISISGDVYDVTPWLRHHPGGEVPLITLAGQDATDAFMAYHPPSVRPHLCRFFVGRLSDYTVPPPLPTSVASSRRSPPRASSSASATPRNSCSSQCRCSSASPSTASSPAPASGPTCSPAASLASSRSSRAVLAMTPATTDN